MSKPRISPRLPQWLVCLLCALLITAAQIILIFAAQHRPTLRSEYLHLIRWDAKHYLDIAENGYFARLPDEIPKNPDEARMLHKATNVAFFPGYPMLVRWFAFITRLPLEWSAVITAQLCAVAFWAYVIALLRRWRIGTWSSVIAVAMLAAYPSAFFLVFPYSESLFLASLLGFMYWYGAKGRWGIILSALHGFVMSATRIFGLFFAAYPLLQAWALRSVDRKGLTNAVFAALAAGAGALIFFLYCQVAFGHWDLYMLRQLWGWSIAPDYLSPFAHLPELLFPTLGKIGREAGYEGRLASSLLLWLLLLWPIAEFIRWKIMRDAGWRERAVLYALAWINFYFLLSALAGVGYVSMIRYTFVPYVFFVLIVTHFFKSFSKVPTSVKWCGVLTLGVIVGLSFALQASFILRFTSGGWVA